jgi:hypothetical protein
MRTEQTVALEPMVGDVVCPIISKEFSNSASAANVTVEAVVGNLVAISSAAEPDVQWIKRDNWMRPNPLVSGWRVIVIVQEA